jgi:CBS domain-containing protein
MQIREVLGGEVGGGDLQRGSDATVAEAVARMVEHGIGSLVVMKDDTLVGFITERDIVKGMHRDGVCLTATRSAT